MQISEELNKVEQSIDGIMKHPSKSARQAGEQLATITESIIGDAQSGITQVSQFLSHEGKNAVSAFRNTVKERPSLTVGLAAGVGLALGLLLSSRR